MTGKELPPGGTAFASDDGSADPDLAGALAAYAQGGSLTTVVAELAGKRLLIPILAELEVSEITELGLVSDKQASAGVVAVEGPDGRKALPVFTSTETMTRWHAAARPVPVDAQRAALSAVNEDWALMIIDPGGPVTARIPRPAVWALAQSLTWVPAVDPLTGVVDSQVHEAVVEALVDLPYVRRVDTGPGRQAEVAAHVYLDEGLDRSGLTLVLSTINAALARSSVIADRVDGLELKIGKA